MSDEARCKDCGLDYAAFGLDLVLPDDQWRAVNGDEAAGLLCATCIARRADLWQGNLVLFARIVTGDDHEVFARTKNLSNEELLEKTLDRAEIAERLDAIAHQEVVRLSDVRDRLVTREFVARTAAESLGSKLAEITGLVNKWRADGTLRDTTHWMMGIGWQTCADELERIVACSPTPGSSRAEIGSGSVKP